MRQGPEAALQRRIVGFLRRDVPPPPHGPWWTAINPVPHKTFSVAIRSKEMGMRAGAPDIVMLWQTRAIGAELKSDKGRLSPEQQFCKREFTLAGGLYAVIPSFEDWLLFIECIGIPTRRTVQ